MIINKIKTHNFIIKVSAVILVLLMPCQLYAQLNISNSELGNEIEKKLLFTKETQEQFDVYNEEYGSNKLPEPTLGSAPEVKKDEEKTYTPEDLNIVMIDRVKIDKDMREKEKLAYNAVLVGQYEIAVELYKEIIQKEPKNLYAKYSLAVVYQRLNQYKQAKNIYYELLKADAENRDEIINNIIAIIIEETPREAIYILNRLTKQNPQAANMFASMGLAYEKIGEYDQAIISYIKAYELDRNNMTYCYNLGVLYDQAKNYEKAVEMYVMVLKNVDYTNNDIAVESVRNRLEKLKQII